MTAAIDLRCRLVSLNYNGIDLLKRFMPSWIASAKASPIPCQLTVLDNQSTDGSVEYLKSQFPDVHVYVAKANKVLCSFNEIASAVTEDILIFLNNDIETDPNFIGPLVRPFAQDNRIFFVATNGDRSIPRIRFGILSATLDYPGAPEMMEKSGYALSAGVGAFDRKKFLEIGGYDEIYLPGYYEDLDLCYRGWKRGWLGLYAPESHKHHLGSASFGKAYDNERLQRIVFRNSLIFMLKNITDQKYRALFFSALGPRLLAALGQGKIHLLKGFWDAIKKNRVISEARRKAKKAFIKHDEEILNLFREGICQKN